MSIHCFSLNFWIEFVSWRFVNQPWWIKTDGHRIYLSLYWIDPVLFQVSRLRLLRCFCMFLQNYRQFCSSKHTQREKTIPVRFVWQNNCIHAEFKCSRQFGWRQNNLKRSNFLFVSENKKTQILSETVQVSVISYVHSKASFWMIFVFIMSFQRLAAACVISRRSLLGGVAENSLCLQAELISIIIVNVCFTQLSHS